MNRFEPTTKDIKKPEAQENYKAPRSVENPEELRQQMTSEVEKQTDQFKKECADDLSRVEVRAEKDSLVIDLKDKQALQELSEEASLAKNELIAGISESDLTAESVEEEKKRSIETLAKEKGVFFVHGIVENKYTDDANKTLETNNLKWNEKLDVILGLEPTLSSSTLKPGSGQETHGRRGVIFSRGKVSGGSRNDIQSIAHGLRERSFDDSMKSMESIHGAIGSENSRQGGYNEIILEKPEVVGVYLNLNSNGDPDIPKLKRENDDRFSIDGDLFDSWACIQDAMKRETGIFVFTDGNKLHRIYDVNEKDKTFSITPELSPEDIANTQSSYEGYVGQKKKKEAVMRVFDKISGALDNDEKASYVENL